MESIADRAQRLTLPFRKDGPIAYTNNSKHFNNMLVPAHDLVAHQNLLQSNPHHLKLSKGLTGPAYRSSCRFGTRESQQDCLDETSQTM